jgi:hypothetical protein
VNTFDAAVAAFVDEVGDTDPVTVTGLGTRGGPVPGVRSVTPPSGIDWIEPAEMTVRCAAGTPVADLAAALAEHGQCVAVPDGGTIGGALAVGRSGIRRLGWGPVRDTVLQARYVSSEGHLVKAGGPTVKNVSGFDLCRLLVGSRGTVGFLAELILRTRPLPVGERWFTSERDPSELLRELYRPTSVLWDGRTTWVLLDGHADDVDAQARTCGLSADRWTAGAAGAPLVDAAVGHPRDSTRAMRARSWPRSASASCIATDLRRRRRSTPRSAPCTSGSQRSSTLVVASIRASTSWPRREPGGTCVRRPSGHRPAGGGACRGDRVTLVGARRADAAACRDECDLCVGAGDPACERTHGSRRGVARARAVLGLGATSRCPDRFATTSCSSTA